MNFNYIVFLVNDVNCKRRIYNRNCNVKQRYPSMYFIDTLKPSTNWADQSRSTDNSKLELEFSVLGFYRGRKAGRRTGGKYPESWERPSTNSTQTSPVYDGSEMLVPLHSNTLDLFLIGQYHFHCSM